MIIIPSQGVVAPAAGAEKTAPAGGRARTGMFGQTLTNRVLSAQLLMDMARVTPFQAAEEEDRNHRKFRRLNRQSLRLHQALLPLVSADAQVSVFGARELLSSDGSVIGGDVKRGAPVRHYTVMVHQLALPMRVQSDHLPAKGLPPVAVGAHQFKLRLEGSVYPLQVEIFGVDTSQMVFQKIIQSLRPFEKRLLAQTRIRNEKTRLELKTTFTGDKAVFDLKDGRDGFLEKLGLVTGRPQRGEQGGVVHRAQDAVIELDGETLQNESNEFDLVEKRGLKLRAMALSLRGPITLEVRRPEREVVRQFSKLSRELNEHLTFLGNEDNRLLNQVYHRYNQFLESFTTHHGHALAGLMYQDGRLALDEEALRLALKDAPAEVEHLMSGRESASLGLYDEINSVLDTPMALGESRAVFQAPLKYNPLVVFLTTSSPFLSTALIAQTEGFFVNLFA